MLRHRPRVTKRPSLLARVVHRVIPCVPDHHFDDEANDKRGAVDDATLDDKQGVAIDATLDEKQDVGDAVLDKQDVLDADLDDKQDVLDAALDDKQLDAALDDKQLDAALDDKQDVLDAALDTAPGDDTKGSPHIPLLPPILPEHVGRKCLVLDLDETLVHSSFKAVQDADFIVPVEIECNWHHFHVLKRPGVDDFLQKMAELYEVVVFTASLSKYADPVLDQLDVHRAVTHRLFRESCYSHGGNFVKDLSQLGRPIADTIIIDNSPASYIFHPHNAVPVSSWFNDPHDAELTDLVPFLADLTDVPDVRDILNLSR